MENFRRYKEKKNFGRLENFLSDFLWRKPSDKTIMPLISAYQDKDICEIGCGKGAYSRVFLRNGNRIVGVDKNPEMCEVSIRVYDELATNFSHLFEKDRFDLIFSGWLTEYLDIEEMRKYLRESYKVMKKGALFITTVIYKGGWGVFYVNAAKLFRGIAKFNYLPVEIEGIARNAPFSSVEVRRLNSWLGIPWAFLLIARK